MRALSRHDFSGWLARRLAVVCSSIMVAAVFLAAAPNVESGDSGAATTLLDRLVVLGGTRFPKAAHMLSRTKHGGDCGPAPIPAARRRGLAGPAQRRS